MYKLVATTYTITMNDANKTECLCRKLGCPTCGPRMNRATVSFFEKAARISRAYGNEAGARKAEAIARGERADFEQRFGRA